MKQLKQEVILQNTHTPFTTTKEMRKLLDELGYGSWNDFDARTDKRIIDFIKENGRCEKDDDYSFCYLMGDENIYGFVGSLIIEDVNILRPWTIGEYDGAEGIQYLDYDVIYKDLNYCELIN